LPLLVIYTTIAKRENKCSVVLKSVAFYRSRIFSHCTMYFLRLGSPNNFIKGISESFRGLSQRCGNDNASNFGDAASHRARATSPASVQLQFKDK
jgi:hypothetical protein